MSDLQWAAVEREFRDLFARRYFANNGPLVQLLDAELANDTSSAFAVACASDAVATAITAKALAPNGGEVLVPAIIRPAIAEALAWAGLRLRRVDIDANSWMMSVERLQALRSPDTTALYDIALFGKERNPRELTALSLDRPIATLCDDSDHPWAGGVRGYDARVLALDYGLSSGGALGATVLTESEGIAKQLRTMRNFHAGETFADVPLRMNGKMSESQAALALVALHDRVRIAQERSDLFVALQAALNGIDGVALAGVSGAARLALDVRPDRLEGTMHRLRDHRISVARPVVVSEDGAQYPNASALARRLVEVSVTIDQVDQVAEIVRQA